MNSENGFINCWEFKKCGREPGGVKVAELGVCPAASETTFNGIFNGKNSGRACWVVAGTFCKGEVQGSFAQKFKNCGKCEFFKRVQEEEGASFLPVNVLMTYIDRTHEQRVDERTHELREAKEAVEAVNGQLALLNGKLANANQRAAVDMKMAAQVQSSFFPRQAPRNPVWDISFEFKPVSGVSGDLYDFYLRNGRLEGLSLFDVSGHGIAPGLLTLLARSVVQREFGNGGMKPLSSVIERVNLSLIRELDAVENYLTGILLRFKGNTIEYVNAGHTDLLLRRASTGRVRKVAPVGGDFKGNFLGIGELESSFKTVLFKMGKDDMILLHSDCLTESRNAEGDEWGDERLAKSLEGTAQAQSSREILETVLRDFKAFVGETPLKDDLTAILVKRKVELESSDYAI